MTVKSSISLTDSQHAFATDLVVDGQFPSVSAVVQHALEAMRRMREDADADSIALREILLDRLKGPTQSGKDFQTEIRAMLTQERAKTLES